MPVKVGPAAAAAAAAAAARHEVQVTQLEDQLAGNQRDLTAARGDLQHASRCFDAAMVMGQLPLQRGENQDGQHIHLCVPDRCAEAESASIYGLPMLC